MLLNANQVAIGQDAIMGIKKFLDSVYPQKIIKIINKNLPAEQVTNGQIMKLLIVNQL